MIEATGEAPKREEQVLVLAAGGLTDKEIAIRLGISPDTVGTYWRRVLAKYGAASRTEVVAKYMENRAKAAMENLRFVNECLTLFNDHMIQHGGGGMADAILASLGDWIMVIDPGRRVVFSNRPIAGGAVLDDLFTSDDDFEAVSLAVQGPVECIWTHSDHTPFMFTLQPGVGAVDGHIVASGNSIAR